MEQSTWYRQPRVAYTQHQQPVTLRRVGPQDHRLLVDVLARLSERSHRLRYMLSWPRSGEALEREARRMLAGAIGDYITLIAIGQQQGHETVLAVGELARDREKPASGEIAILVRDDAQGQGIGTLMGAQLMQAARRLGIITIRADLLAENTASLRLVRRLGVPFRVTPSQGALQVVLSCEQAAGGLV
jgi:acetyltransferase